MIYQVTIRDDTHEVSIEKAGEGPEGLLYRVVIDGGEPRQIAACRPVDDVLSLLIDNQSWEAGLCATESGYDVEILGAHHPVMVVDPRRAALQTKSGAASGTLTCSMPGRVIRIMVQEGDPVEEGQPLVVIEAMKMENELRAPQAGQVRCIHVSSGDQLDAGAVL
ncbi:MAG: biotin/lipoyl-containing protein, partial [Myxococcota bacterium]|nr:biotin/lipoyl-containing protein [Myxococcota bacterium]